MSDFQDYVQGLQMLGGVLALPRSAQYAQQGQLAHRRMLQDTGMDPADIQAMYPDAPLQWLAPGEKPGIGGKILGGVGDVGALLSTIAGQPIGPPRMSVEEVASASKMRKSFKEQQALNELAKTETDPVGKALLGTGSMDAYGRYKAAQVRGQGGAGTFGTSALGARSRLAWLEKNQPDSPDIPALRRGIAEEDARHPIPQPPEKKLTPGEQYTGRWQAIQEARKKLAESLGHKEGTPEYESIMTTGRLPLVRPGAKDIDYNFFFKQALEQEQRRAAADIDEVNMDTVKQNADKGWAAYDASRKPRGGTTPPGQPTPPAGGQGPPGPPAPRPESIEGPVSTTERPPPGTSSAQITEATPEQLAARRNILALASQRGIDPRGLRESNPDLWAAADLAGIENLPAEQVYQLLNDPVAFAQWRAGQAQQGAAEAALPGMTSEKTGKPMSSDGVKEFLALSAEMKAGASKERQAQIAVRLHQLE